MPTLALPPSAARISTRQHGVVSGTQLLDAGLTRRQIRSRLDAGALDRVLGDTFRVAGCPVTTRSRYMAATLAVPGSSLALASGGDLHGFAECPPGRPAVLTTSTGGHAVDGITVHRSRDLWSRHRCVVDGIPVTTVPRTVIDLAGPLSLPALERLVGDLIATRRISAELLFDELDLVARQGRTGARALRTVLVARLSGNLAPESELERIGLAFLRRHGFGIPVAQFTPPWSGRAVARVDMAYLDERVVLEFDGRRWHDNDDQFEQDRVRDQLAMAAGWVVFRITWRQLHDDPTGVVERLRSLLAMRSAGR